MNALTNIHKAHCIGIGGIGVSAIARMLDEKGVIISGSDVHLPESTLLPQGTYVEGHDKKNLPTDSDIVIYSDAVPLTNPERQHATELDIPQRNFAAMLGYVTREHRTIAISGTHGKSTTSALLGMLAEDGGLDPSVFVGAVVPRWNSNYHKGGSNLFIVEADEYNEHMMELTPSVITITNLELDHPDYYLSLLQLLDTFRAYVRKLPETGMLILNADDANAIELAQHKRAKVVTYGFSKTADLSASSIFQKDGMQYFDLTFRGKHLGTLHTTLPGKYNIANILAACATYLSLDGNHDTIQDSLTTFNGVGRRFEILGHVGKTAIISDYAHHPTALKAVVTATYERYPGSKILTVFRPHQKERTRVLFDDYVSVLREIHDVILVEIYDVPGREGKYSISSTDIVDAIKNTNKDYNGIYADNLQTAEKLIRERIHEYDHILIIGAGDADLLAKRLLHAST